MKKNDHEDRCSTKEINPWHVARENLTCLNMSRLGIVNWS